MDNKTGYRGEVMLSFKNRKPTSPGEIPQINKPYEIGNKVGQLIILPYPYIRLVEAEELSETERGANGHGSTGK